MSAPQRVGDALPGAIGFLLPSLVSALGKALSRQTPAQLADQLAAIVVPQLKPELRHETGRLLQGLGALLVLAAERDRD